MSCATYRVATIFIIWILYSRRADVTDNMNIGRIANPTEKDFARLKEYALVKEILEQAVKTAML